MLKVAVLSSTRFGYRCIEEALVGLPGMQLCGIVTTPRNIRISYSESPVDIVTHADFSAIAQTTGCGLVELSAQPVAEDYLKPLSEWKADVAIALGWYYMVPKAVREAVDCLGIHASLLPRYRGGAPLPWAIINGEKETGVTLFYLEGGVDSGDILGQRRIPITREDTIATLYEKIEDASINVLTDIVPALAAGTAVRVPQDESEATVFPQRTPADGLINWDQPTRKVYDFIRAQTAPYPGAFWHHDGTKVTVWEALMADSPVKLAPGGVEESNGNLIVGTADGALELTRVSVEK